jgi:hypothetical protein
LSSDCRCAGDRLLVAFVLATRLSGDLLHRLRTRALPAEKEGDLAAAQPLPHHQPDEPRNRELAV